MRSKKKDKFKMNRRKFLKIGFAGGAAMFVPWHFKLPKAFAQIPGGTLDPVNVSQVPDAHADPAGDADGRQDQEQDGQERGLLRDFDEAVPAADPAGRTYPADDRLGLRRRRGRQKEGLLLHNAPSLTIEAKHNTPVRIKWINDLVDANGNYLPHLLPVDQTLHWANPPGGTAGRDTASDLHHPRPVRTPARCPSSPTCTARSASATRATATPRPGTCRPPATFRPATPP